MMKNLNSLKFDRVIQSAISTPILTENLFMKIMKKKNSKFDFLRGFKTIFCRSLIWRALTDSNQSNSFIFVYKRKSEEKPVCHTGYKLISLTISCYFSVIIKTNVRLLFVMKM